MHQLVAVSPDMLIGQFFCECHRHNAEMTPALHFAQWLFVRWLVVPGMQFYQMSS